MASTKKGKIRMPKHDAKDMLDAFAHYMSYCKNFMTEQPTSRGVVVRFNKPRVPTLQEFCVNEGISVGLMQKYQSKDWLKSEIGKYSSDEYDNAVEYEKSIMDLHNAAQYVYETVGALKLSALVNGEGNANGLMFDLRINHGMTDKVVGETESGKLIEVSVVRKEIPASTEKKGDVNK